MSSPSRIKTLSLFTGAGGLDIGFHTAGFEIVGCVELETKYCRTLEHNRAIGTHVHSETEIHNLDIRDFDVSAYKGLGIECVIGGPPCQTFSAAGRRAGGVIGTDDERGQLYEAYCNILDELDAEVFVFENVYGLPGANGGGPWKEITGAFADHGYDLNAVVIDAADYGVPQHRERLFMVGSRGAHFEFPMPTVGPDSDTGKPLVSVLDAIGDLQSKNERYGKGLGGLYGHLLPEVPEGLNYAFFTAEMGHPEPVFAWRSKFHDLLYKVNKNTPCRTIKANPGKFTGPFHWKNRHFTISELKRLQTFPDDYELVGSYSQVLEQIGNSVPPRLAMVLAESIKEQLLRAKQDRKHKLRPDGFKSTFRQRQRERSSEFKEVAQRVIRQKYGKVQQYIDPDSVKPITERCYVQYRNLFERDVSNKKPKGDGVYKLVLTEAGSFLRQDIDQVTGADAESVAVEISVTGLRKYLPRFESFRLDASIRKEDSLFACWREIEVVLTQRSQFFTLIDIYGHYANRGDVVDVSTNISGPSSALWEMITYFSQTANCQDL